MLGAILLIVGFVLFTNGMNGLMGVGGKAHSVANIMGGVLLAFLNMISIIQGNYLGGGTGFLFAVTYLWIAANALFNLDTRPYGIFSLFVAITATVVAFAQYDIRMLFIWLAWAVLWLTGFIETVLKKKLGKFVPVFCILCGIFSAWIPGILMLLDRW